MSEETGNRHTQRDAVDAGNQHWQQTMEIRAAQRGINLEEQIDPWTADPHNSSKEV